MYSVLISNMLTCVAVFIFIFYSKSVESHLISGMAVQETNRNLQKPTGQYNFDSTGLAALIS